MYNEVTVQGDSSVIAKMPSPENNFLMFIVHELLCTSVSRLGTMVSAV